MDLEKCFSNHHHPIPEQISKTPVEEHGSKDRMTRVNNYYCCLVVKSCLYDPMVQSSSARLLCPWDFPGKHTGVGCHFLLQGNLPHPGIEPGSPALQAEPSTIQTLQAKPSPIPTKSSSSQTSNLLKCTLHLPAPQLATTYTPLAFLVKCQKNFPKYHLLMWIKVTETSNNHIFKYHGK